ncbi:hypothetical protein AQJ46_42005 [Streptomyces canus]|uniref:Uncharacterized protein n=1 Tax=Streptomyces canus TaxID=58343 RepID=A0A101RNK4_9ACTN|nr:hypothetical protein [Streptomyces canus]KUN58851.1 hypothetical protein AQJ46_42005 [Streptomyces canus]
MALSTDERSLLTLITNSPDPVVMSDFFHQLSPPAPGMNEHHPGHEEWLLRQIEWHSVSVELWQRDLVRVVVPANGERGDMVEPTEAGRAALAA